MFPLHSSLKYLHSIGAQIEIGNKGLHHLGEKSLPFGRIVHCFHLFDRLVERQVLLSQRLVQEHPEQLTTYILKGFLKNHKQEIGPFFGTGWG